jgi:hypothetical protein
VTSNYPEESVEVPEAWMRIAPLQHVIADAMPNSLGGTLSRVQKANQRSDAEFDKSKNGRQL